MLTALAALNRGGLVANRGALVAAIEDGLGLDSAGDGYRGLA